MAYALLEYALAIGLLALFGAILFGLTAGVLLAREVSRSAAGLIRRAVPLAREVLARQPAFPLPSWPVLSPWMSLLGRLRKNPRFFGGD
jgi:hypothetical protein